MYEKYNQLTIISEPFKKQNPSPYEKHKLFVKVRCDCGVEKVTGLYEVKKGKSKSCGCYNLYKLGVWNSGQGPVLDHNQIIQEFKDGASLAKISKKNKSSVQRIRKIIVKAGLEIKKRGQEHYQYTGYKELSGNVWSRMMARAKKVGMEFNITKKYCWELFENQNKQCVFTGLPLILSSGIIAWKNQTASLDRIDSSKGYIEGNVQWVHRTVNFMKLSMTDEEFINWCTLITKHRNPKLVTTEN